MLHWICDFYEKDKALLWFAAFYFFGWQFGVFFETPEMNGITSGTVGLALVVDMHRSQQWHGPPPKKDESNG